MFALTALWLYLVLTVCSDSVMAVSSFDYVCFDSVMAVSSFDYI